MILEITSATWIVTGLGFGIVLVLLFCLVFIMQGLGWVMQKVTAPKKPKTSPEGGPHVVNNPQMQVKSQASTDEAEIAAIAYALYLAQGAHHDATTTAIHLHRHETAWNAKEFGLNNKGF